MVLGLVMSCQPKSTPYQWDIPEGFPLPLLPVDNPMTEEKVALGRHLFYDRTLSGNGQQSCADCHQQETGFSDARTLSVGSTGELTKRNSQSLVNVAYNSRFTWAHSGLTSIEQQLLIPMFSEEPVELGITGHEEPILAALNTSEYQLLFEEAFGDNEISFDRIVKALASFVRSLTSFNSPFDDYAYRQDDSALSESALRGLNLFFSERLECHHCHGGFNFTQSSQHDFQKLDLRPFHNTGLYNEDSQGAYPLRDQGLIEVSKVSRDMGRFRAPTLRNVALSAPYMHDGSLATLEDVVEFYAAGGTEKGRTSPIKSPFLHGFSLTEQEKSDLIAFLHSLTDRHFIENEKHSNPFSVIKTKEP